jgi:hypothetical protein
MAHSRDNSGSSTAELLARGLDLSARGIDLIQTLAQITNSPNGAVQTASKVVRWLANERINENDLSSCLTRARDLAHPNEAGEKFCSEVLREINALPRDVRRPFKSLTSGSLGRLLLLDPGLSWITTTITSLYQYHTQKFITFTVTALLVRMHDEIGDGQHATQNNLWKNPLFRMWYQVITKITGSIWLNIVNAQKQTLNLPPELRDLCLKGHHLDEEDFIEAVARLKNPVRGRSIVITTDYMLSKPYSLVALPL